MAKFYTRDGTRGLCRSRCQICTTDVAPQTFRWKFIFLDLLDRFQLNSVCNIILTLLCYSVKICEIRQNHGFFSYNAILNSFWFFHFPKYKSKSNQFFLIKLGTIGPQSSIAKYVDLSAYDWNSAFNDF